MSRHSSASATEADPARDAEKDDGSLRPDLETRTRTRSHLVDLEKQERQRQEREGRERAEQAWNEHENRVSHEFVVPGVVPVEEGDNDTEDDQNEEGAGGELSDRPVSVLDRVLSRASSRGNPGPPPDGGMKAWITGLFLYSWSGGGAGTAVEMS